MKAFILAISFACLLAVASSMIGADRDSVPLVEAQGIGHWLIVSKSVQGTVPESDWQFVYLWSGSVVSSNFVIDKNGGVTSFRISMGAYAVISELVKSGYMVSVVYGSMTNSLKVTDGQVAGNAITLAHLPEDQVRTFYADFFNSFTKRYVGGVVQPPSYSPILTLISLLGMVVTAEAFARRHR